MFMLNPALSRPPGIWLWLAAGGSAVLLLMACSADPMYALLTLAAAAGWGSVIGLLLVRVGARVLVPRRRHRRRIGPGRFWTSAGCLALTPILTVLIVATEAPLRARLVLSLPFLSAAADAAERSPATVLDLEDRYGPVRAIAAFKTGGGTFIETWERASWDAWGRDYGVSGVARFASPPSEPLTWTGEPITVRHLWGRWYMWWWGTPEPAWSHGGPWRLWDWELPVQ